MVKENKSDGWTERLCEIIFVIMMIIATVLTLGGWLLVYWTVKYAVKEALVLARQEREN